MPLQAHPALPGWRVLALGAAVLLAAAARGQDTTRAATLEAIHQLENPRDLARPGPCGELGAYQFRAATWRSYTTEPFARALDRQASDDVAQRHYEWLKRGLVLAHVAVTPYTIGLAWNGGLTAAISGRTTPAARDYAERVANLVSAETGPRVAEATR